MLKIMVCMKRKSKHSSENLHQAVRSFLKDYQEGFERITFAQEDEAVAAAQPIKIVNTSHPKDAVMTVWCDHPFLLEPFYKGLSDLVDAYQVYTAVESQPIAMKPKVGRVRGMCQIALIKKPKDMERKQWLQRWLGDHTKVAVETQSNFSYRQNIIQDADTDGDWPVMDAIIEENFPEEAMTRRDVFFDAKDDEEKYKANEKKMIDSCLRFIDFEKFDCIPMSEYIIKC
jgi:hypothetical protein